MSVSERIGLPPFLGWMTDQSFLVTLLICWAITPGMMIVLAVIGESRWLPLGYHRQFLSFFPGDLFLGAGIAALLMAARELPEERRWFTAPIVQIIIFAGAFGVAYWLTRGELRTGVYPKMAILSPTKLYHNFALYGGYGYIAVATLVAVLAGSDWSNPNVRTWLIRALIFVSPWVLAVVFEGKIFGPEGMAQKARNAHVPDWVPIWNVVLR
jgi:hypothetical protein